MGSGMVTNNSLFRHSQAKRTRCISARLTLYIVILALAVSPVNGSILQDSRRTVAPNTTAGWTDNAVDAIQVAANRKLTPAVEASGIRGWWRNRQVTRAAARLGYDADKVRYVEEIGAIGSKHPLGGVRNKHTGEILIDKFAFD